MSSRGSQSPLDDGEPLRLAPLSMQQEGLHFFDRQAPDSAVYSVPYRFDLEGPLDVEALRRALEALVQRHEILRTRFIERDGAYWQQIMSETAVTLPCEPLTVTGDEPELEAELERLAAALADAPFDLERGPLMFASLRQLSPTRHALFLRMHHIVFDGWSYGVLTRDLDLLYRAARSTRPAPLPALTVQFADYARWQRERLASGALDDVLAYWRARLVGAPALVSLPTGLPRPAVAGNTGRTLEQAWPEELGKGLVGLARALGVSPFVVMATAVAALLARYTGQRDVCLGFPVDGRGHSELPVEDLIGYFSNTLVLRAQVEPELSFRQLVERVRDAVAGAIEHGELPFDKLVEALAPTRTLAHHPLFQVCITYQAADEVWRMGNVKARHRPCPSGISKFDVTFDFERSGDQFRVRLEYADELYLEPTMWDVLAELQRLIARGIAEPDGGLADTSGPPAATQAAAPARSLRKRR
ncbi:MAG: hypothetical protein IPI49_31930 [Myxococcales bacterium]|nr:hypothetical protein [Myxococcales bacterium]